MYTYNKYLYSFLFAIAGKKKIKKRLKFNKVKTNVKQKTVWKDSRSKKMSNSSEPQPIECFSEGEVNPHRQIQDSKGWYCLFTKG